MKFEMHLGQLMVLCSGVLIAAEEGNRLTKIWSVIGAVNTGASVVNISDGIAVPYQYARRSRDMKIDSPKQYVFRPRAILLKEPQETNVYYSQDNKYKSEILFPGNYFTIAKEKSSKNLTEDSAYNPFNAEPFKPQSIPLMRGQNFQRRSLDEEQSFEEPEEDSEVASRRSLSYVLGVEGDEDGDDEEIEDDSEEVEDGQQNLKSKIKHKLKKAKKYSKYMMPLLLAYKLKYFALVPVLISGLILLVGATGMAGFFFALFAAVMGLQKGGY